MQLSTIDVDPAEARAKLDEYAAVVAAERTVEDAAIAAGYRAAARGLPLISLSSSVQAGGFHANGLPRIAVVRADAKQCAAWREGRSVIFCDGELYDWRHRQNRGALVNGKTVRVDLGQEPPYSRFDHWSPATTIVPIIPPRHRPRPWRLRGCHILWEVESWTHIPPKDPALIKHIRGDVWAVLATWDLTELERHVLSQRS